MIKSVDIDKVFQETITKLQSGHRVFLEFTNEEFQFLLNYWSSNLNDTEKLHKVLCLLDFTKNPSPLFTNIILKSFQDLTNQETLIYVLNVFRKHEVERSFKTGDRINGDLLMALKELLTKADGELLEWCLRTIEELGHQSIFFKQDVLDKKPSWILCYNKNNKASRQIIELLEKRWSRKL